MLAPLGAVSLLYNALLARFILDDFFSKYMIIGTTLIAIGAVLIGYFGVVQEPTHSLDDLLSLFARPTFVAFASLFALTFIGVLGVAHLAEWQLHVRLFRPHDIENISRKLSNPSKNKKKKPMTRRWSAPSLAPVAEVSESSSGIATPVLAIADEAARRGIPVERVLMQRNSSSKSVALNANTPLQQTSPKPDYGSMRARGSSVSSSASSFSSFEDTGKRSTSAAALAAAEHDPAIRKVCLGLAIAYGGASGTLSGACLLLAKTGVELLVLTIGGINQFDRWQSWFLVIIMLSAALLQLWYLNKSLRLASPPLVCPLAFCFYNTSSIALGMVYFDQLGALSPVSIILVILGTAILLSGVWMVSLHGSETEDEKEARVEGERQPLLSDVQENVTSPVTSPSLLNAVSPNEEEAPVSAPTETEAILANAAGIAGPHLPHQLQTMEVCSRLRNHRLHHWIAVCKAWQVVRHTKRERCVLDQEVVAEQEIQSWPDWDSICLAYPNFIEIARKKINLKVKAQRQALQIQITHTKDRTMNHKHLKMIKEGDLV
ncbi:hypothetical protein L7F22_039445 [Adiantum nelumboides]|nr:hypothetical protein [Adiantum nelumboides]